MKEKFKKIYGNAKEFVSDHSDELIIGAYWLFMGIVGYQSIHYMHMLNKSAKLDYTLKQLEVVKAL